MLFNVQPLMFDGGGEVDARVVVAVAVVVAVMVAVAVVVLFCCFSFFSASITKITITLSINSCMAVQEKVTPFVFKV